MADLEVTAPQKSMAIVWIGALVLLIVMGIRASFGLFLPPMSQEFNWGRDVFSLAFAIQNIAWGIGAILMGMLADKYGSGRTIALSGLLLVIGIIGMRYANTELTFYLFAGCVVGLGQAGTTFPVILPLVARHVPLSYRGTAMGIVSAGGSMGQFVIAPFSQWAIDSWQWSSALWLLSLLAIMILPLSTQMTGKPDAEVGQSESMGRAVHNAIKHPTYHLLFWGYAVCGFHTAFITLHLPAFVTDHGLAARDGAIAIALIGLFNVLGSYGAGRLGTVYSKKNLLVALYSLRALVIAVMLALPMNQWVLYGFAACMGLLWLGTVPLTNGLVGQIYGFRYAATLSAIVFLGHQVGSFTGVWLGGAVYERLGSYDWVWWISIGLGLMAAILSYPVDETDYEQRLASMSRA